MFTNKQVVAIIAKRLNYEGYKTQRMEVEFIEEVDNDVTTLWYVDWGTIAQYSLLGSEEEIEKAYKAANKSWGYICANIMVRRDNVTLYPDLAHKLKKRGIIIHQASALEAYREKGTDWKLACRKDGEEYEIRLPFEVATPWDKAGEDVLSLFIEQGIAGNWDYLEFQRMNLEAQDDELTEKYKWIPPETRSSLDPSPYHDYHPSLGAHRCPECHCTRIAPGVERCGDCTCLKEQEEFDAARRLAAVGEYC